ncbi:MAG: glycerate kinase [Muriicola sp.]|nr:glycerate kinase [Muriicola sp.]NNK10215.1 hypothetical protein [Flavobacteriaceae bacterium]
MKIFYVFLSILIFGTFGLSGQTPDRPSLAAFVFLNAELASGITLVKELANFGEKIRGADWIITGEGKLDEQTLSGKAVQGVLESAKKQEIPVAAFCGVIKVSKSTAEKLGLSYTVWVSRDMPNLEEALKRSYENVVKAAADFAHKIDNA